MIIAKLEQGKVLAIEEYGGPASDTSVPAGGTADIELAPVAEEVEIHEIVGIIDVPNVKAIHADLSIDGISVDNTPIPPKITITLRNTGGSDVPVPAGAIKMKVGVIVR